jgi:cleavage and polyadenylation specificity factor subunit 3
MTRIQRLVMFLEAHFGDVELHMPEEVDGDPEQGEDNNEPSLLVSLDEADARINLISMVRLFPLVAISENPISFV